MIPDRKKRRVLSGIFNTRERKLRMERLDKSQYNTFLAVMIDSLRQKLSILNELFELTREQSTILASESGDIDEFNLVMTKKEEQLKQLGELDQGFEQLFQKVKTIILEDKETYRTQITLMQELIRQISEKSVKIETMEKTNQKEFELFVSKRKNHIKNFKMSNKTVINYYKNIGGMQETNSLHLDKRK